MFSELLTYVRMRCASVTEGSGDDGLLPVDEQTWRICLATNLCYSHLSYQEQRRAKHHRHQLRTQVWLM